MSLHQRIKNARWPRLRPFIFGLLLLSPAAAGQTPPANSATLQDLVQEVRLLRRDLQTATVAAQRAQILLYRVQAQQQAVARAQQKLDAARARLAESQSRQKEFAANIKRMEEILNSSQNQAERKDMETTLTGFKAEMERLAGEEPQLQTRESEAEQELRSEQAKLSGLEYELDRLDKALENLSRQPESRPQ